MACLSETCLDPNRCIPFRNHHLVHKARNRQGGGSGILIRKNLDFDAVSNRRITELGNQHNVDISIIKINVHPRRSTHIISLYNPPRRTSRTTPAFWRNFFTLCSRFGNVIVCGDFNAHSPTWSTECNTSDKEGELIESALIGCDLICINDGSATWSAADGSYRSALDLTILSADLATISSWRISSSKYGSDHFPILTTLGGMQIGNTPCRPIFAVKEVDWTKFRAHVTANLVPTTAHSVNVESAYEQLTGAITNAIVDTGGKIKKFNVPSRRTSTV